MRSAKSWVLLFICTCLFGTTRNASAQTPGDCSSPVLSGVKSDRNLFNEQQEEWLGEIMDQEIRRDFHVIEDPDGNLQRIGERLLAQLPPTKIHYRFVIIDSPGLNSFSLAGGRIYIYRRMIAFVKSEDELAALLGHEIGHIAAHQVALDVSDYFRELGITSVGDRQDVINKWNQFHDNARKIKHGHSEDREQKEQLVADRVGLYAMTRAGYDPAQFISFVDRSFETKGKAGGFWSDFFGTTTPESKRLREIMRNSAPLPPTCIASHPDVSTFAKWQQSIIEAKTETAKADVPGLVKKIALQPRLRNELNHLQFSPDGKYLLAQDDSSIFLLTREPLKNLFRIDAPEAHRARFTPDSLSIVFDDKEMRVQKWDIASERQSWIRELSSRCSTSALSPTGEVMACAKDTELQVVDVQSGQTIFSKKKVFELSTADPFLAFLLELVPDLFPVHLEFSPDGRYLVGSRRQETVALDVTSRTEIKLPGKIRDIVQTSFAFAANDELFGVNQESPRKAVVVRFPTGEVLNQFPFAGTGHFSGTIQSHYVMMEPAGVAAIAALDLNEKKILLGYKTLGFAIYKDTYAGDNVEGAITLYKLADKSVIDSVTLPDSPLSATKTSSFSTNGKWLAVSGRTRGAVWALDSGQRLGFSRDFDGAFFNEDELILKYPKRLQDSVPPYVVSVKTSPLSVTKLYDVDLQEQGDLAFGALRIPRANAVQMDDLLVRVEPVDPKKYQGFRIDVRDVRTNTTLWQLEFAKSRPRFSHLKSGETITFLIGNYDDMKAIAKLDPALNARLDALSGDGKKSAYIIQVYEARAKKLIGNLLVETGNLSFKLESAASAGDNVFVYDSLNRTLVYSLKSGKQTGKIAGKAVAVAGHGDKVLIENAGGSVDLYDASSLQVLQHFSFPSGIARAEFGPRDNLMVLTKDQTVYQIELADQQKAALP